MINLPKNVLGAFRGRKEMYGKGQDDPFLESVNRPGITDKRLLHGKVTFRTRRNGNGKF